MDIILLQDVANLGSKDDNIVVKSGYGRNYLIPQRLAILATPSAKKVLAENQKQRAHKESKLKDEALMLAEKLKTGTKSRRFTGATSTVTVRPASARAARSFPMAILS